ARLMTAALRTIGLDAVEVTPDSPNWPIVTDENYGDAEPILEECKSQVKLGLRPLLERGKVPVVCGFVGKSLSGKSTTLGRGGSDTTAILLANCLGADELVLVKDVAGIYSADPRKVREAKPLKGLEAEEAYLLASTGAEVLHSKVFKYKPDNLKIRIVSHNGKLTEGGTVIQGIIPNLQVESYRRPITMITIVGNAIDNPEILTQISQIIKERKARILSLTVDNRATILYVDGDPIEVLRKAHTLVRSTDYLKAVSDFEDLALIVIRGRGLGATPGMIQKVTTPLADKGINIYGLLTNFTHNSIGILIKRDREPEALESIKQILGVA
ncbi:MAG: aspartate kinase, partial [Candidatus Bathyarchaeia archaeon]